MSFLLFTRVCVCVLHAILSVCLKLYLGRLLSYSFVFFHFIKNDILSIVVLLPCREFYV